MTYIERLRLAYELLRTHKMIFISDRLGVIYVPFAASDIKDIALLTAQRASLEDFRDKITVFIREFDRQLDELQEEPREQTDKDTFDNNVE